MGAGAAPDRTIYTRFLSRSVNNPNTLACDQQCFADHCPAPYHFLEKLDESM